MSKVVVLSEKIKDFFHSLCAELICKLNEEESIPHSVMFPGDNFDAFFPPDGFFSTVSKEGTCILLVQRSFRKYDVENWICEAKSSSPPRSVVVKKGNNETFEVDVSNYDEIMGENAAKKIYSGLEKIPTTEAFLRHHIGRNIYVELANEKNFISKLEWFDEKSLYLKDIGLIFRNENMIQMKAGE